MRKLYFAIAVAVIAIIPQPASAQWDANCTHLRNQLRDTKSDPGLQSAYRELWNRDCTGGRGRMRSQERRKVEETKREETKRNLERVIGLGLGLAYGWAREADQGPGRSPQRGPHGR